MRCILMACAALVWGLGNAEVAEPQFTVEDIGVLSSEQDYVFAQDLNNGGQVVGEARTKKGVRAFIWDPERGMHQLGGLSERSAEASAQAISDSGVVVGSSRRAALFAPNHAFRWSLASGVRDLGSLRDSAGFSTARDVNDAGDVTGTSSTTAGDRAFLWTESHGLERIGRALPAGVSRGLAMNDAGSVVGYVVTAEGNRAFRWKTQGGTLLRQPPDVASSLANAINSRDQVVGRMRSVGGVMEAVLWQADGDWRALGAIGSRKGFSEALDINDLGWVVGRSETDDGLAAFLWTPDHGMRRLTSLIRDTGAGNDLRLFGAPAVNEAGQIIAFGRTGAEQKTRSYVLTPAHRRVASPVTRSLLGPARNYRAGGAARKRRSPYQAVPSDALSSPSVITATAATGGGASPNTRR